MNSIHHLFDIIKTIPHDGTLYLLEPLSHETGLFVSNGDIIYMVPNAQHSVYGTGRADGQPRQRACSHKDSHRRLRICMESEAHNCEQRGNKEQAETFSRRKRLPRGYIDALTTARTTKHTDAGRATDEHHSGGGAVEAI